MSVEPVKHLFTVDEYERMGETGVLAPDQRVELLGGEIIEMTPIGSPHAGVVNRLTQLLVLGLAGSAVVTVQNPVRLSDLSEPQPDLIVARARADFYATRHPRAEDVLLMIEVADTSARWDRRVKRPFYAAAGISEVWIVDIAAGVIEVATGPAAGGYERVTQARPGESLAPIGLPGLTIAVSDILG